MEAALRSEPRLMKGNEALAEAAIRAGMQAYFGYPITPQSEILEYLTLEAPKRNFVVVQAESELAAINMIYGAGGAGARVMTSSSSPGISLMQEGISYMSSAEIPALSSTCSAEVRDWEQSSRRKAIIFRRQKEEDTGTIDFSFWLPHRFRKWPILFLKDFAWRKNIATRQ